MTAQDLKRCRFMMRITAPTDEWSSLYLRPSHPRQHPEAAWGEDACREIVTGISAATSESAVGSALVGRQKP